MRLFIASITIIASLLTGCTISVSPYDSEKVHVSNEGKSYEEFGEHGVATIFDIAFPIPGTYLIEDHPEFSHIKTIVIGNNQLVKEWPNSNGIFLVRIEGTPNRNLETYLASICTKISNPEERYVSTVLKQEEKIKVTKIKQGCSMNSDFYIPPTYTEYIIEVEDNTVIVSIDEEADPEDMRNFEELMKNVELADEE